MSNCPICSAKLLETGFLQEDGDNKCVNGHYYYSHSYGAHNEHYDLDGSGHITLSLAWGYTQSKEEMDAMEKASKAFLELCRFLRKLHADQLALHPLEETRKLGSINK